MQANFTTISKNNFLITEGDYTYRMPFVLKHLLVNHLVHVKEGTTNLPVGKWFLSLADERQVLVKVTEKEATF
jgi:hypothetical protein